MHVIFVAPHFPAGQRRFVRGLKNVGARVTGIGDGRPEHLDDEIRGLLDGYEYVSHLGDEDAMVAAVERIQRRGPWVHHLEATIEAHTLLTARVRERTGIPGLPHAVVERCRDKLVMKAWLRERGIPCARSADAPSVEAALRFAGEVGYPLIVKPRKGAGAQGTSRVESDAELVAALRGAGQAMLEEFITGHEGFWDTLTVNGRVCFEGVSHYYPGVLDAMRHREYSPMIITTNRLEAEGYRELFSFGRRVLEALEITTSATHMEWFFGPRGLSFSEIGARPPGVNFWDVYTAATGVDIYTEWARAVCWADTRFPDRPRKAGGILNLRPERDGTITGASGVDSVIQRYGRFIEKMNIPSPGTPTQPVEAGYLANGWVVATHPDFDALRHMFDDIGRTIRLHAL